MSLEKLSKSDLLMKQLIFSMPQGVYPGGEEIPQRDLFFCKKSNHCEAAGDGRLGCSATSCPSPSGDFRSLRLDMASLPTLVTQACSVGLLGSFLERFPSLMERTMQGIKHLSPPPTPTSKAPPRPPQHLCSQPSPSMSWGHLGKSGLCPEL